jgi:iron-sulfur cluster assembly accessory protein
MSVETFDVTRELVSVTDAAAEHLRSSLAGKGKSAVRIAIEESGCTGFKYVMEEVDDAADSDVTLALTNGVKVFIAPNAVALLQGTEIDYVREGINRTLKFKNPNVTAECGCGESFTVA